MTAAFPRLKELHVGTHITSWNLDPWTGGPYSTLAVGGKPSHRAQLAELIGGRVALAGEYVSVSHPATMHGAYNSGVLAAERLIATVAPNDPIQSLPPTAIVIGAGLAGLSAAQKLRSAGFAVSVFEATAGAGGRARTQRLPGGALLHPGAAWIHGSLQNPVAALMDKAGIQRSAPWPVRVSEVRQGFGPIDDVEAMTIQHAADQLLAGLAERAQQSGHAFHDDIAMAGPLADAYAALDDPALQAAVKVRIDMHFESLMAADLNTLSFQCGDEPYSYQGGDEYITSSMQPLTDSLTNGLDVQYQSPVARVELDAAQVRVALVDGRNFTANVCVVAVPLGPLQAGSITFTPSLPDAHNQALNRLHLGQKCKVYLQFSKNWWGDLQQLWIYPQSLQPTEPTRWALWVDASKPSDVPMLCGFLGGRSAQRAQQLDRSDSGRATLTDEALNLLTWALPQ